MPTSAFYGNRDKSPIIKSLKSKCRDWAHYKELSTLLKQHPVVLRNSQPFNSLASDLQNTLFNNLQLQGSTANSLHSVALHEKPHAENTISSTRKVM